MFYILKILILLLAFCNYAFATNMSIRQQIDELLNSLSQANVGVIVQEPKSGKILYQRNHRQLFMPASTLKLFTATAAILELGAGYQYVTKIKFSRNNIQNNILYSDVHIIFTGDPTFSSANLKKLISSLNNLKITKIEGNIYIDASRYDDNYYPLGWLHNSINWYYNPPITALTLDDNKLQCKITANKTLGELATITNNAEQIAMGINIQADINTVTYEDSEKECQLIIKYTGDNNYKYSGCWPINMTTTLQPAIRNPMLYVSKKITSFLQEYNISLAGKIKPYLNDKSKSLDLIAIHYSAPLTSLLEHMLRESDNLYAESFIKEIGYKKYNEGSFKKGIAALEQQLKDNTSINFDNIKLLDGSGTSVYNLITPVDLNTLLTAIYSNSKLYKIFKSTLPRSGYHGTLKNRLNNSNIKGKILAKTGTLTGCSGISGFINTKKGNTLTFTLLINNSIMESSKLKKIEDKFCELVYLLS